MAFRIHFAQLPPVTGLKLRRLGHVEFGLYAAPSYLDRHCTLRRPDDLSAHLCLTMASVGRRWQLVHARSGQTQRVEFRPSLVSNDHHALRDATIAGAGIGLAPSFLCHDAVEAGELVRVLPRWSVERATLSMLWPATRQRSPRVQAFVELATSYFKQGGYFVRRR